LFYKKPPSGGFFMSCATFYNITMIDTHHVFVADAKPALALPTQRSAYVFGAASALGEALLNQLLASPRYSSVYVSTTAPLPGSVAHLSAVLASDDFAVQDEAEQIDYVLIVNEAGDVRPRSTVYASLLQGDVAGVLRQVSSAAPSAQVRYLFLAPAMAASQASAFLASYAAHGACMVYGNADGKVGSSNKGAYQFKPQTQSLLDRLGVWVLNVLSNAAHGMLNQQNGAPFLTSVKIAQRLVQRFEALALPATGAITVLKPDDLKV
jgi:hypothetical protein